MPTIQTITNASGSFPYVPNTRTLTINGVSYDLTADRSWTISTSGTGTVTSVGLSATMPTGLVATISGSPITSNGTLGLTVTMQSGYAIPTTAKQTQWDSAYTFTSTFPSGSANQLLRVNSAGTALEFFTASFLSSTGTTNYIPKFTSSTNIGNSIMLETSGLITIYGNNQLYKEQAGAGLTSLTIDNKDTAAAQTNSTVLSTQQLGSGQARTIILAASNTAGNKSRGELSIITENGSNFISNIGTQKTNGDNAFSLFSTSYVENIRLNTGGTSWLNGGNIGIGTNLPDSTLQVVSSNPKGVIFGSSAGAVGTTQITTTAGSSPVSSRLMFGTDGTGWQFRIAQNLAGTITDLFTILTGGNVGINQLNPTEKLDVVGNIKLSGNVLGGTWQGNTITPAYGGTGATSLTGVVIGNGTSTMTAVSGTAGQLLRRNAGNTDYEFFTASFIDTSRTITINGVTQDLSANRTYNVGTVTSVSALTIGTTGTDITSSVVNGTTTPVITINIPTASNLNRGALSSADWTTFNSKQTALNGTGFVKISGTTISYDNSTYYLASNPSNYITLSSLSAGTGISYNNTTGVISSTITQYTDALARLSISENITGIDYNNTTGVFSLTSGYVIPTTTSATNWDAAYNDKINSASVTGTTTKTLTLNQQDGGTITASWTDINTDAVTSVFGRTGAVIAANGDYTTAQVTESGNLYYTDARARAAISLTTTGSSGAATYTSGVLNIPNYTLSGLGGVSGSGTTNYLAKFTGSSILGDSQIIDNGTNVGIGVTPSYKLHVQGTGFFNDNVRFPNTKGLLFENVSTSAIGSIKMGSSVTNNLEITNGTHTITLATLGTFISSNLLVGASTIGTSATNTIAIVNGTAPSSSATDIFHLYSADVTAGNAAPHFRTENGAVIKIYQETTSVGNSIFNQGGGNSVLDDSTFDGYTLRQIVKALRNQGILQ